MEAGLSVRQRIKKIALSFPAMKKEWIKCVMFLAENSTIPLSASIAFDRSNTLGPGPNPYNKQKERTNSVSSRNVLSFSVWWKRGSTTMRSSLCSDEIQGTALDEIKSVLPKPAKQDFIAKAISSTRGGFHPSKTDLTAWCSKRSITLNASFFFYKPLLSHIFINRKAFYKQHKTDIL